MRLLFAALFAVFFFAAAFVAHAQAEPLGADATDPADDAIEPLRYTATVPLTDGRVDLAEALAVAVEQIGLDGEGIRDAVTAQVNTDVTGLAGALKLRLIEKALSDVVLFETADKKLHVHVDRLRLRRLSKDLRTQTRDLVARWFPDAAARAQLGYGMHVHPAKGEAAPIDEAELPAHVVVTIHGLDERIPVRALDTGVQVTYRTLLRLVAPVD